jgi:hypothetical protein
MASAEKWINREKHGICTKKVVIDIALSRIFIIFASAKSITLVKLFIRHI